MFLGYEEYCTNSQSENSPKRTLPSLVYENENAMVFHQQTDEDEDEEDEKTIPYFKPTEGVKTNDNNNTASSQSEVNVLLNQSPIFGTRGIEKYFLRIPTNDSDTTTSNFEKKRLFRRESGKQTAIVKPLPSKKKASNLNEELPERPLSKISDTDYITVEKRKVDERKEFIVKHGDKLFGNWLPKPPTTTTTPTTELEDSEPLQSPKEGGTFLPEDLVKAEVEDDQPSSFLNTNKKSRNKEASKQYREKRKHAVKEVFQRQRELEEKNNSLREQIKSMEDLTIVMQKTFAKKMDTKDKIKMEIMKLIQKSASNDKASDLQSEITVLRKIFQRVANENLTKGCVEKAIYEILGEVITPQ